MALSLCHVVQYWASTITRRAIANSQTTIQNQVSANTRRQSQILSLVPGITSVVCFDYSKAIVEGVQEMAL